MTTYTIIIDPSQQQILTAALKCVVDGKTEEVCARIADVSKRIRISEANRKQLVDAMRSLNFASLPPGLNGPGCSSSAMEATWLLEMLIALPQHEKASPGTIHALCL